MSRDSDKSGGRLIVGGPARANLLPPEVGAAAKGKIVRRNAVLLVIFAVLVSIAGYAGATVLALAAQVQLEASNQRTQVLLVEQSKFAEVQSVKRLLETAKAARTAGTSTEIDWKEYLDGIQAILPEGTKVTNVVAEAATPLVAFSTPSVPLQGDRIGELTFTATSESLPDVEQWLQSLATLVGYVDATPGSVSLLDNGTYQVSITMHINKEVLSLRFDDERREARDKERAEEAVNNPVTPAPSPTSSPTPSPSPGSTDSTDGGTDDE